MIRRLLAATLHRLGVPIPAQGGSLPSYQPRPSEVLACLSPGRQITDPDEAEALGLRTYPARAPRRANRSRSVSGPS